ncbi:MAG: undecaprenyl-phosphate glucose phosphotransferase [Beijerinckiaceae bacterium]
MKPASDNSVTSGKGHASAASGAAASRLKLAEATLNLQPAKVVSAVVIAGLWRIAEALLLAVTSALIYWAYLYPQIGWQPAYALAIPAITLLAIITLQAFETYQIAAFRAPLTHIPRILAAWTLVFLMAFTVVFFMKLEGVFSRLFMGTWFAIGLCVILLARLLLAIKIRSMTRNGLLDRRTAIVGGGEAAEKLLWTLQADRQSDLSIFGVFDDRFDERSPDVIAGHPKLGNVDDLVEYARHARLDLVIFALPITAETRLLQMLKKLWVLPIDISLAAHSQRLRFRPRNYSYIGSIPVLDMMDKPIADWDVVLKWLFDKIVGSLLLVMLFPVMVLTALAVKLNSRGPVFFRQKRYGFNNEMIEIFKFRSMYVEQTDATASRLVTRDDPRVTSVGRFIRKTSLDELPQLFNVVFKGDLSIVGPRPHAVHAKAENRLYDEVVDGYFARHRVKPGITGWAQINGWRGETDTEEKIQRRVECDLHYIENWSLWFDVEILARTPFSLVQTENAY